LHDVDQRLLYELEDGEESHRHAHAPFGRIEQPLEVDIAFGLEPQKDRRHALPHGKRLSAHVMMRKHRGASERLLEDDQELLQRDVGQIRDDRPLDDVGARLQHVALEALESIDVPGGFLEPLVLLEPPDQLGAWILFVFLVLRRTRQQHSRFDLGERGGHHEVFACELELHLLHELDVLHVLARNLGDRDVENVEVLPPDQVQQ
jgi:hypothetical protein